MIRNYIVIAWRNIKRNKLTSFINLASLAVGMACCMMILLFIKDELSYNRFNENFDNIFRIDVTVNNNGESTRSAGTPVVLGPHIQNSHPGIKASARMYQRSGSMESVSDKTGEGKKFQEQRVWFSDKDLFRIFSVFFKIGNPAEALKEPNTVVVTEETAQKYFGTSDVLGNILVYENRIPLKITGVVQSMPEN
jgi:putative ABC transport system permease protein